MTFVFYQYFQVLSLVMAIIFYKGLQRHKLTAFIPLLFLTIIIEIIGMNYSRLGWEDNYFLYNIYILLLLPLQLYLFSKMLFLTGKEVTIFLIISMLGMLAVLLNYFFIEGPYAFNSQSLILLEVLNIIFSCLALFRLSFQQDRYRHLFNDPYFWINAVTFLFGLVALVLLGLQPFIRSNKIIIANKTLYHAILPAANVVLYSGYSYAFILCRAPLPPLLRSS